MRKSDIGALLADIGLPLYGYDNLLMASKVKCLKTHRLRVKYNKRAFFMHFSVFRVSECQRWCMASVGETSAGSAVSRNWEYLSGNSYEERTKKQERL